MKITAKHYAQALYESVKDLSATDRTPVIQKFLATLYSRGELKRLPEILRIVGDMEETDSGVVTVTVATARDMDTAAMEQVVKTVTGADNPLISQVTDEDLIGGLTVETKDKRWDMSVRGQLRALQHTIRN